MKTTGRLLHAIGLALVLAVSSQQVVANSLHVTTNKLPAPKPEFLNSEQLAEWRAKKTADFEAKEAQEAQMRSGEADVFFTGKPYLGDSGTYAFLFRFYDPELSRWTSADPSGFPDGANNHWYAPCPSNDVDPTGAYSLGGITTPSPSSVWNSPGTLEAIAWSATKKAKSASSTFSSIVENLPPYSMSFAGTELGGSVTINHYRPESTTAGARLRIQMRYSGTVPDGSQLVWLQAAYKDTPVHSWSYIPDNGGANYPWYPSSPLLNDYPGLPWTDGSKFTAFSFLGIKTGSDILVYDNPVQWGFEIHD